MATFELSVVAPDKTVIDEEVVSVVAPGVQGYFGILAGHEPFITQLKTGIVEFKDASGRQQNVAISGGFLEASGAKVIILAEAAETGRDIDKARAAEALERAKQRLAEKGSDINVDRANAAVERAANRLKAAN